MIWKDLQTSKYPIDTFGEEPNELIYGMGKVFKDGSIKTRDGYLIGKIDKSLIAGKAAGYIKFSVRGLEIQNNEGISFIDFQPISWKGFFRVSDSLSRIIFQYRIRYDPLTF